MPADFDKCRAEGGQIRTKVLEPNETYMHICVDKDGKTHAGEVKKYKKLSRNSKK